MGGIEAIFSSVKEPLAQRSQSWHRIQTPNILFSRMTKATSRGTDIYFGEIGNCGKNTDSENPAGAKGPSLNIQI